MQFDCKMFIKYVNDMKQTKNDRKFNKKVDASNATNANSNFSDLIKFCQKIKSISMRKNQIFSALFVFLDRVFVFFDRVFALQNRNVIIA